MFGKPPQSVGRMLKEFPDWLLKGKPRPGKRIGFCTWNYFTKDSPLPESGLLGPVQILTRNTNASHQMNSRQKLGELKKAVRDLLACARRDLASGRHPLRRALLCSFAPSQKLAP